MDIDLSILTFSYGLSIKGRTRKIKYACAKLQKGVDVVDSR